ncbi:T9SS type A sorting domain-containing protein [bacterium]|nr:T9SS type A sorting domain-containing protein [bacterium]
MHRTILLFMITMLAIAGTTHAQPDSLWSRTYGGEYGDVCFSAVQTSDRGFALAGYTLSFDVEEISIWLVRTDENGDSLWSRIYGGDWLYLCNSIVQTSDGGFALAGGTVNPDLSENYPWLLRTDENGDSLWSRRLDVGGYGSCSVVVQTMDGDLVLGGRCESNTSDSWLAIIADNGDTRWLRRYRGIPLSACNSLIQTEDGGFLLVGITHSLGQERSVDFGLLRTDKNGDSLWTRNYGGSSIDECYSIIQTADGGFALVGGTYSFGEGRRNIWLLCIDVNGDSLWSRTYGGRAFDNCSDILQTDDGGFALVGTTLSFGAGEADLWLVRTDDNGDSLWSRTFGGYAGDGTYSQLFQTDDGGFALTAVTNSFGAGSSDFWLVKTGPDPVSVPPAPLFFHPSSFILHPSFPNPFNSTTNIRFGLHRDGLVSLRIIDLTGNAIETLIDGRLPVGYHTISWNSLDYPAGVYICNMQAAGFSKAVKMVLVK